MSDKIKVVVSFEKRDAADWYCNSLKVGFIWGKCYWDDNAPSGMSFLYEFPPELEDEALLFSLKFA